MHKCHSGLTALSERLLREAESMNPGPWSGHSRTAAMCAHEIAGRVPGMDADLACACGLLHDIGRRFGVTSMRHTVDGYRFLTEAGLPVCARICLTHSFPHQDIAAYSGKNDCSAEDTALLRDFLQRVEYDEYDRLIQLCDALAGAEGAVFLEKRMMDVAIRHGIGPLTVDKWKATLALKARFDAAIGGDLYDLFAGTRLDKRAGT